MTLTEIRDEIWNQIGRPSDLDPSTDISYGGAPLLDWVVSEGQRQVASWKDPVTRFVFRLPQLQSDMNFKTVVRSFTLGDQTGATTSTVILPAGSSALDDRYNGWVVGVGSEYKYVVDYDGATLTLIISGTWTTQPAAAATLKLYKRFMMMGASTEPWISDHITLPSASTQMRGEGNFIEIQKLTDLDQGIDLTLDDRIENNPGNLTQTGEPMKYARRGNRIYFEMASATEKWYRMEYYRLPGDLAGDDDIPEIPLQYHYAITLWGVAWGMRRAQDYAAAYATERSITDYLRGRVANEDIKYDRTSDHGKLRRK